MSWGSVLGTWFLGLNGVLAPLLVFGEVVALLLGLYEVVALLLSLDGVLRHYWFLVESWHYY